MTHLLEAGWTGQHANSSGDAACCTASDVHVLHTAHKGLTASLSPACAEAWEMHVCRWVPGTQHMLKERQCPGC